MSIQFLTLTVAASSSGGAGSVTDPVTRSGRILAIGLDFASATDAGCDTTVSVTGAIGPAQTLLTVTDSKTDGWFCPRLGAVTAANVAIAGSAVEIPFFGQLTVTVAQAGASVTAPVAATIYYED